jgi:parallel beta-helix repeat protein
MKGKNHMSRLVRLLCVAILLATFNAVSLVHAAPLDTVADAVLGQPDLNSNSAQFSGRSANTIADARGVAIDPKSGRLFVADTPWDRVLSWPNAAAFTNFQAADLVLGKPDFVAEFGTSATTNMYSVYAVAVDSVGNVYVADTHQSRVLRFSPPFSNGMAANLVIGQPDFTSNTENFGGISAATLNRPTGVAIDPQGNLWVADSDNHRVLRYSPPFSNGMAANLVIGQPDFTSNTPNFGGISVVTLSISEDSGPGRVDFDAAGNLYVSDSGNNRVLRYSPPFSNFMAATLVIGQPDFTSNSTVLSASGLRLPGGSAVDVAGNLYIADQQNNRILQYTPPFSNGMAASRVFGQPDFTSRIAYNGGVSASSIFNPYDVVFDAVANLYVTDTSRVLRYDQPLPLPPGMISCATSSLQTAVNAAQAGSVLTVLGTCNENTLIRNDKVRVFLNGGGTATINGTDPTRPALDVRGKAISIQGFTITGGSSGVEIQRGANAVIDSNVIDGTGGHGVVVNQLAFGVLTNDTIQNNEGDGVVVREGAAARIGFNTGTETVPIANTIQMNSGNGITVSGSSSARVVGNDINHNGGHGIEVMSGAQADISNNIINSNGGDGIFVTENSSVQLGEDPGLFAAANSGVGNGGFGISCDFGGALDGLIGTLSGNMGATNIDASCPNSLSP